MAIELTLPLAVARGGFGMGAPIGLLIIGVLLSPLLPAILDHLRIDRVGLNLPPVVIGPAMPLALRLAADDVAGDDTGMDESFAGSRDSSGSGSMRLLRNRKGFQVLSKPDSCLKTRGATQKEEFRDYCRVLTASSPRLTIDKTGKIAGVLFRH